MHKPALIAFLIAAVLGLSACGHSRIVQRDGAADRSRTSPSTRQAPSRSRAVTESIPRGAVHVVSRGETLYGISFRYGLRYQDVAAWNDIGAPYTIEIGQRLQLRPAGGARARPPVAQVSGAPRPRPTASPPLQAPTPGATATTSIRQSPAADIGSQSIAGGPSWSWPAHGQIIGRYVSGDQTQQGINIAGSAGQDVKAASDGIVVYSGAGLVGYGELIIIKHSEEWLSAYAHNRKRNVGEGTRVKAGQVIAEMGRTGAMRDMLHFEIRRNGKPVDPLIFLPKP